MCMTKMNVRKMKKWDQMGLRPTHFKIGTIITLGLSSESHHRTSSSGY